MTREREKIWIVSVTAAEAVSPKEWCGRGGGFDELWDPATCGVRCAHTILREMVEPRRLARAHSRHPWWASRAASRCDWQIGRRIVGRESAANSWPHVGNSLACPASLRGVCADGECLGVQR